MLFQPESSVQLQNRDWALLRDLFECRIMTSKHIAEINFEGKLAYGKKRIQQLKAEGLIGERKRRVNEPSVLFLTRNALKLLRDEGMLRAYPSFTLESLEARGNVSELTIRHELEVMDVKAAFHSAFRDSKEFSIEQFSTWPRLHEFEALVSGYGAKKTTVRPDGFIRIRAKRPDDGTSEQTFFLELDRSTESQDMLVTRAGCYLEFYKSGGFAVKNGAPRSEFKEFPFRVLMVFKTAERRNNTAERLLQHNPPILTQVCLSTLEEVKADPLGAIWTCPRDYRELLAGTASDTERQRRTRGYKRKAEREAFVEGHIKKFSVLA